MSTKSNEKTPLKKGKAQFTLIGKAKVNDYTFDLEHEFDSGWTSNRMGLSVDCGDGNVVFAEMSGGYFPAKCKRENKIYVHGKQDNGNGKMVDDFDNRFTVGWNERNKSEILETIGNSCFVTVGIEKNDEGKTHILPFYHFNRFITEYDAVKYLSEHLTDGMVVNINGDIAYETNGENTYVKKKIKSVFLSKAEPEDYKATFVQTILLDDKSIGKVDKDKNTIAMSPYVVDYVGSPKIDDEKIEIKQNFSMPVAMEFEIGENTELTSKQLSKFFKAKKNEIIEITVEGKLVEGGSVVNVTLDDLPDDIKELVELGLYTEEEMLTKAVGNSSKERRMVITKPYITYVGEDDEKKPTVAIDKTKYKESDLSFLSAYLENCKSKNEEFINLDDFEDIADLDNEEDDDLLALLND